MTKRLFCKGLALLLFLLAGGLFTIAQTVEPAALTCEYLTNPLGIDISHPRLSWQVQSKQRNQFQSAYELEIRADNHWNNGSGLLWTSGKVESSESLHIDYKGPALNSFTRYYWRVRIYDLEGRPSNWSQPAWFETALLSPDDWTAAWISDDKPLPTRDEDFYEPDPMPLFRTVFKTSKKIASARLYITGLGYYEAYLNGKKVGDHELDPGWTRYDKEILYSVFDVSSQLKQGANTVGIMVGNGWFNVWPMRMWGRFNLREALVSGRPMVKAQLRILYKDGSVETIHTDRNWQMKTGPVIRNSVYRGEEFDARAIPEGWLTSTGTLPGWTNAREVDGPGGVLKAQLIPPIRVTRRIQPQSITEVSPGVYLADMGQNFAGMVRIRVKGTAGTTIILRYGEDRLPDGNINVMTAVTGQIKSGNGGPGAPPIAWQEDRYTLSGKGVEEWQPRFTFHGFRYVEIRGWPGKPRPEDIIGLRMNSDVQPAGSFVSSNSMFNRLDTITDWTFRSNMFSVQSDCPGREKFGYGGDIVATAESFLYRYDMANFYRKAISDFRNDQCSHGGIPETAPFVGIADKGVCEHSGPIGWQLAYPYMIRQLYDFYGDKAPMEELYETVVKQVALLQQTAIDGLHFLDISDHESLDTKPEALSASVFYLHHVDLLASFAQILGKPDDAGKYSEMAGALRERIRARFHVTGSGRFDLATQAAQIFAFYYKLVPEQEKELAWNQLLAEIRRNREHLSTGIFSTKMLFDVLREMNQNEWAYTIANQRDYPGWGHMIEKGATTLWETWAYSDNVYSQNHPMFGSVSEWFYRSLLGINSLDAGFRKIQIKPQPAGDLKSAKGHYESVRGRIGVEWRKKADSFEMEVDIPSNTEAEIWIPASSAARITESGKSLLMTEGIRVIREEAGYVVLRAGGGSYQFLVKPS